MKDGNTRRAILKLHELGYGYRKIARTLRVSRWLVGEVIKSKDPEPPESDRGCKADEYRDRIIEEIQQCKGNLVRVSEELHDEDIKIPYATLTRFIRKNELNGHPKRPFGRYVFDPGEESQFDTSPHHVRFVSSSQTCQCASIILGYSRMLFFQYYPRFTRFECKLFLTDALRYFQGACKRCIIDNTNLAVLHGTGPEAIIVPEMDLFSQRFGFVFQAHRLGDKNRSGKIERPFHYIENNFLVKRTFQHFKDLNEKARWFSDRNNQSFKPHLRARPCELFARERSALIPLPPYIPEVYQIHTRNVDPEGYISLHANYYSAPYTLIGSKLDVRETHDGVTIHHKHREVGRHERQEPGARKWMTDPSHRPPRGMGGLRTRQRCELEEKLTENSDLVKAYVDGLKQKIRGQGGLPIRRLYRMSKDYPRASFEKALSIALQFRLFDLNRLETIILKNIAGDYFQFEETTDE